MYANIYLTCPYNYKLTPLGISAVNDINESFDRCLYDWFNKYNISL
jgi:hypothetical protein